MAVTLLADNHHPAVWLAGAVSSTILVDRWTLTGISPCCACTCDGRVDL